MIYLTLKEGTIMQKNPIQNLRDEHGAISIILSVMKKVATRLKNSEEVKKEHLGKIVEFLINFADKCHHGKEENVLFPLFNEPGKSASATIASFLEDHERGRAFVRALAEAVAKKDTKNIIKNARGYAGLLPKHIKKENEIFPKWIGPLSDEAKEELFEKFEKIEEEVIGLGKHHEYIRNIEGLKKSLERK